MWTSKTWHRHSCLIMSSSGSLRCGEVSDRLTGSTRTVQVHPRSSVKRQTANDAESRRSHISIMQKIKMGLSDSLSVKSTISPVSLGADLQRDGTLQHDVYLVGIRLICKAAKWQNNQKCNGFFFFSFADILPSKRGVGWFTDNVSMCSMPMYFPFIAYSAAACDSYSAVKVRQLKLPGNVQEKAAIMAELYWRSEMERSVRVWSCHAPAPIHQLVLKLCSHPGQTNLCLPLT